MIIPITLLIQCVGGKQKLEGTKLNYYFETDEKGIPLIREIDITNNEDRDKTTRYITRLLSSEIIHELYEHQIYIGDLEQLYEVCIRFPEKSKEINEILYYIIKGTGLKNIEDLLFGLKFQISYNPCYNQAIYKTENIVKLEG